MAAVSFSQHITLLILAIVTSIISIIGSSFIIRYVRHNYKAAQTASRLGPRGRRGGGGSAASSPTYLRLLLGMSCYDILYSINLVLQPLLVDTESQRRYDHLIAFGNVRTCNMSGCLHQIGFGGFIYYGMLSFYFLFSVRMGKSQAWIAKKAEPFMHFFAIGFSLTTGFAGLIIDCYSFVDLYVGCWVANYPKGCQFPRSPLECNSDIIGYVFGGTLFAILIPTLIINNSLVYFHVRKVYGAWSPPAPQSRSRRWSMLDQSATPSNNRRWSMPDQSATPSNNVSFTAAFSPSNHGVSGSQRFGAYNNNTNNRNSLTGAMDGGDQQNKRLQQVATQATSYVVAALLTYMPLIINELGLVVIKGYYIGRQDEVYGFMVVQQILSGLGGFWNGFIFFRPMYLAQRRNKLSRWAAVKKVLFQRPPGASVPTAANTSRLFNLGNSRLFNRGNDDIRQSTPSGALCRAAATGADPPSRPAGAVRHPENTIIANNGDQSGGHHHRVTQNNNDCANNATERNTGSASESTTPFDRVESNNAAASPAGDVNNGDAIRAESPKDGALDEHASAS